jgi:hypothetical protein
MGDYASAVPFKQEAPWLDWASVNPETAWYPFTRLIGGEFEVHG